MRKLTTTEFIIKATSIHGDLYDYSKVIYTTAHTKVNIICNNHGSFYMSPNSHLNGRGCPECAGNMKKTTHIVIEQFKSIHGDVYDYSNTIYINDNTKLSISCKSHGEFLITPSNHIHNKRGCPVCGGSKKKTQTEILNDFINTHGKLYDYSKVYYINDKIKVCIICDKHGEFWQLPSNHKQGNGCPNCITSKGEDAIRDYLVSHNITFYPQHKFETCRGKTRQLPFDFYIPSMNTCIEYDGAQHEKPIKRFGGENGYRIRKQHDTIKDFFCKNNGITLIRISHTNFKLINHILLSSLSIKMEATATSS